MQEQAQSTDVSGRGEGQLTGAAGQLLAIYTATTFLSALLLFSVQPMFAKMVLPILGGSPSVWAVAMVFFQAMLLAGYCWAHLLIAKLGPGTGGLLHLALTGVALLALPIGVPTILGEPPPGDPAWWQLKMFAVGVGLPFLAVSANAPLVQAWFAQSGHAQARDPYFLYGASNLGSLLALLAYPLVLEPAFGVTALAKYWAIGFVLLFLALALCVLRLAHGTGSQAGRTGASEHLSRGLVGAAPSFARRLGWVALAFVPSALLTAFTTHITMDVASAPLLWVMPLALYLLTFVLVFRDRPIALIPAAIVAGLGVAAVVPFLLKRLAGIEMDFLWGAMLAAEAAVAYLAWHLSGSKSKSMEGLYGVHIGTMVLALLALAQRAHEGWFVTAVTGVAVFFAGTMVAHRTLYETRPAAGRLTEFYLLMALGGVLGGLFSALIAPRFFSQVFEYPILLALTAACRPGALRLGFGADKRDELYGVWVALAASILAFLWVPTLLDLAPALDSTTVPAAGWWIRGLLDAYMGLRSAAIEWGATVMVALLLALALVIGWRHPARQLALALAMAATVVLMPSGVRRADAQRSYFGVYRVYPDGEYNVLTHGTTLHGAQKVRDEFGEAKPDATPGTYYYPQSPMARSVTTVRAEVTAKGGTGRFGVIGLGSGSLTCLAAKGETWTVFEIDPLMVRLSSDPKNFTYLASCQPSPPNIVIGDARLTMSKQPDGNFDLIIVDAFTSDAVPIHLMTAEAVRLYLQKVGPNGAAVLHISNRYLDLDSVLGATVKLVPGAVGLLITDDDADGSYAQSSSTIAVFAKSEAALAPFRKLKGVRELDDKDMRAWTDDYSDIIGPFLSRVWD